MIIVALPFGNRALSSVVERLLHTQEVTGSNPVARTIPPLPEVCRASALLNAWFRFRASYCCTISRTQMFTSPVAPRRMSVIW